MSRARYARYVAIGDSSTEGLDDPDGNGGYRGWANRLAEHLARVQGQVAYANLAIRGRRTAQIREEQLAPALAMEPDLVTLFTGTNDVVSRSFDLDAVMGDIEAMQTAFTDRGVTVLTFTMPDLVPVMPLARLIADKLERLNDALRTLSRRNGAILVDFARVEAASDPRLWSDDRLHANASGHERIAAALAHALALPGADDAWMHPLTNGSRPGRFGRTAAELRWWARHLLPWIVRHARGRSSGDGRVAKQPSLRPVYRDVVSPSTG